MRRYSPWRIVLHGIRNAHYQRTAVLCHITDVIMLMYLKLPQIYASMHGDIKSRNISEG